MDDYRDGATVARLCKGETTLKSILLIALVLVACTPIQPISPPDVESFELVEDLAVSPLAFPLMPDLPHPVYLPDGHDNPLPADSDVARHEADLIALLLGEGQQRLVLTRSETLDRCARLKAQDMGNRGYFGHVSPDGEWSNDMARRCGYPLAASYTNGQNYIESLGSGYSFAQGVWGAWLTSPGHKAHLFGENDFYREQNEFGVGYAYIPNSEYTYYWVVLFAKRSE